MCEGDCVDIVWWQQFLKFKFDVLTRDRWSQCHVIARRL